MRINVRVLPRSSKNEAIKLPDGTLKIKLTAPPVEGEANAALVEFLSDYFGARKKQIKIVRGLTSKNKTVEISD